jgi:hypothetical protein
MLEILQLKQIDEIIVDEPRVFQTAAELITHDVSIVFTIVLELPDAKRYTGCTVVYWCARWCHCMVVYGGVWRCVGALQQGGVWWCNHPCTCGGIGVASSNDKNVRASDSGV